MDKEQLGLICVILGWYNVLFFNDKMYVCSLSYLMAFSLSLFPGLGCGDININTSANAVREPANQCFRLALFLVWSKCMHTVNVNLIEGINLSKTVVTSLSLLLTTYRQKSPYKLFGLPEEVIIISTTIM